VKKDFLFLADLNKQEILELLERTEVLKKERRNNIPHPVLKGKSLGMIFSKNSTRTRISFEVGMFELGGHALYLTGEQLQLKRGETIEDSARVLSRYLHGILIRNNDIKEAELMAQYADIPIINGLTDKNHPVQVLCDLFTLKEKLGKVENFTLAYVGDGNNMTYSWMEAAALFDFQLNIATPLECKTPGTEDFSHLENISFFDTAEEAVKGADVIYADVWVSMGMEAEEENKMKLLQPFQINQRLLELANSKALVMHCLPAHRGDEITGDVLDGPQSVVFDQAENRLHTQKALLEKLLS